MQTVALSAVHGEGSTEGLAPLVTRRRKPLLGENFNQKTKEFNRPEQTPMKCKVTSANNRATHGVVGHVSECTSERYVAPLSSVEDNLMPHANSASIQQHHSHHQWQAASTVWKQSQENKLNQHQRVATRNARQSEAGPSSRAQVLLSELPPPGPAIGSKRPMVLPPVSETGGTFSEPKRMQCRDSGGSKILAPNAAVGRGSVVIGLAPCSSQLVATSAVALQVHGPKPANSAVVMPVKVAGPVFGEGHGESNSPRKAAAAAAKKAAEEAEALEEAGVTYMLPPRSPRAARVRASGPMVFSERTLRSATAAAAAAALKTTDPVAAKAATTTKYKDTGFKDRKIKRRGQTTSMPPGKSKQQRDGSKSKVQTRSKSKSGEKNARISTVPKCPVGKGVASSDLGTSQPASKRPLKKSR